MIKWSILILFIVAGLGYWIYKGIADLPGIAIADQGREHKSKEENDKFVYNSYPPTSGPHDIEWIKPGVYNSPQDKYKLGSCLDKVRISSPVTNQFLDLF